MEHPRSVSLMEVVVGIAGGLGLEARAVVVVESGDLELQQVAVGRELSVTSFSVTVAVATGANEFIYLR